VRSALGRKKASLIEVRVQGDNLFDITPERIQKWWARMFEDTSTDWPYKN